MIGPRARVGLVLAAFAAVFTTLTVSAYVQKSATVDEPVTVAAGYLPLERGDFRLDPQHPPLLRMWSALPLLFLPDVELDTTVDSWAAKRQWDFAHDFLYRQNDADRLLNRARFMIVLLGIALGVLLFSWAHALFGFWPAVITLALYTLEPNILAHASLATTDLGVTCLVFATMFFLWRTAHRASAGNVIGLAVSFALAQIGKFSALLLGPLVVALLAVCVWRAESWPQWNRERKAWVAAGLVALLTATTYVAIWAVYDFRYRPAPSEAWTFRWQDGGVGVAAFGLAQVMAVLDDMHLLPNAYAQGFVFAMGGAQKPATFLAGAYSSSGFWSYYPVAFVIKTPIAVLVLAAAGLVLCGVRRQRFFEDDLFVLLPLAAYLAAGVSASAAIGLRYILPIYPFVLLLAGKAVAAILAARQTRVRLVLAGLGALAVTELWLVHPHHLAFFNLLVGGARNGHRYLVDSNLDWGQDLKLLKAWMDENGVRHVNLSYFGSADPAYHGIDCTHLPGAPFFVQERVIRPELPGYLAISATNLREVYAEDPARSFYAPFREQTPVAVLGHSIFIYWVERPWW